MIFKNEQKFFGKTITNAIQMSEVDLRRVAKFFQESILTDF